MLLACRAGFLDFYIDASIGRPEAVWKDLTTMGYDRSFKKVPTANHWLVTLFQRLLVRCL